MPADKKAVLERAYARNPYPQRHERAALAERLEIPEDVVANWYVAALARLYTPSQLGNPGNQVRQPEASRQSLRAIAPVIVASYNDV